MWTVLPAKVLDNEEASPYFIYGTCLVFHHILLILKHQQTGKQSDAIFFGVYSFLRHVPAYTLFTEQPISMTLLLTFLV